jgi:hypothetical protein
LHRGFEATELGTLVSYLAARHPTFERRLAMLKQVWLQDS